MAEFRQKMSAEYLRVREGLSPNSIKTYVSIVYNLVKKLNLPMHMSVFETDEHLETIMQRLNSPSMNEHSRKNAFAALFVLTSEPMFEVPMLESIAKVKERYQTGLLSKKEALYRVKYDSIVESFKKTKSAFRKEKNLQTAMNFLIAGLTSGFYLPMRRKTTILI